MGLSLQATGKSSYEIHCNKSVSVSVNVSVTHFKPLTAFSRNTHLSTYTKVDQMCFLNRRTQVYSICQDVCITQKEVSERKCS